MLYSQLLVIADCTHQQSVSHTVSTCFQVPTRLGTTLEWIKFIPNDSPAVCSQLRLIVKAVAGEPVSCCMVAASTQTSTAAELQTSNGNLPEVVGNQPFDMEVFAVDKHGNR